MDKERWLRIEAVFDAAFALPRDRRSASIEAQCDGDQALAAEVAALFEEGQNSGLLDQSAVHSLPDLFSAVADAQSEQTELGIQQHIGPYQLLKHLGAGGMGVVFLAARDDGHFEHEVAVKVCPGVFANDAFKQRFLLERQILARLQHPHIATLLDGGVANDGSPYLVMEYVAGVPIDQYCVDRRLSLRARLDLFLEVCAAVSHAHRHLVVHRDIKPGNILVDDEGSAKLLDFGVAKLLEKDAGASVTVAEKAPLTLEYAAPEQIAGGAVTTATDVYALGVLLFRLLTDALPFDLRGLPMGEVERTITTEPAPAPSKQASDRTEEPLAGQLRGDLDNIVAKALRKQPEHRYSSADELTDDLCRFIEHRPVQARAGGWTYRGARFVRRHRAGAAAALLIGLSSVAGIASTLWQARVAIDQRQRAEEQASKTARVSGFLQGLFRAANPYSSEGGQLTVRDLLERGERRLGQELSEHSDLRAEMLLVIAEAYAGLGQHDRSIALAREARDLLEGAEDSQRARANLVLGEALYGKGEYAQARPLLEEAWATYRRQATSVDGATTLRYLALSERMLGRSERGKALHEQALARWRELGDKEGEASELSNMASLADEMGQPQQALQLKQKALDALLNILGPDHPTVANLRNNVAFSLHRLGAYDQAEQLYRQSLDSVESTLGPEHPDLADQLTNLGRLLMDQGRFKDAEALVERAMAIRRATTSETSFNRIGAEMNLATLRRETGKLKEAAALYRRGLVQFQRQLGEEHPATARVHSLLAQTLQRRGELAEAERHFRAALNVQRGAALGQILAETLIGLGGTLRDGGDLAAAEPLLREGLEEREAELPTDHWQVAHARAELAGCLLKAGHSEEAQTLLDAATPALNAALEIDDYRVLQARFWLAELHSASTSIH